MHRLPTHGEVGHAGGRHLRRPRSRDRLDAPKRPTAAVAREPEPPAIGAPAELQRLHEVRREVVATPEEIAAPRVEPARSAGRPGLAEAPEDELPTRGDRGESLAVRRERERGGVSTPVECDRDQAHAVRRGRGRGDHRRADEREGEDALEERAGDPTRHGAASDPGSSDAHSSRTAAPSRGSARARGFTSSGGGVKACLAPYPRVR